MILKERYNLVVKHILDNGVSFPKKHGCWCKLDLFNNYYLQLDSWNRKIHFCKGVAEYNEWTGFETKNTTKHCLGIDFGGFECYNEKMIDWLVNDILKIEYGTKI